MLRRGLCKCVSYTYRLSRSNSTVTTMQPVNVRNIPGEERLQISFSYGFKCSTERQYTLLRSKVEPLSATLDRLNANITKNINKKRKKKKSTGESDNSDENQLTVKLFHGVNTVPEDMTCEEAFTQDASLIVSQTANGDSHYKVEINPPTILSLKLPTSLIPGCPVMPQIETEFTNMEDCKFEWFRSESVSYYHEKAARSSSKSEINDSMDLSVSEIKSEKDQHTKPKPNKKIKIEPYSVNNLKWEKIFDGPLFMPSADDVERRIKVMCTPKSGERSGKEAECICKSEIAASPDHFPCEKRHMLTQSLAETGSFRMVSYNILADIYADTEFTKDYLFPYCPEYALEFDYRKQLIIKELLGYNADIICLQEVDKKLFIRDLEPLFNHVGFKGMLKVKANESGEQGEGVATFLRKNKFRCVAQKDIILNESLRQEEYCQNLWSKVASQEALKEKVLDRATPLQVCVLELVEQPGRFLVVGTTHLFFHPKADNIRIIQALLCTWHLNQVKQEYTVQGKEASVIFCGDFNSSPGSGVHQLLTKGFIHGKHADWYSGGRKEFVEAMDFQQPLCLTSACGYPEYTNYVTSFRGCLDYIYIEESALRTSRIIPLPSTEEVTEFTALPNHVFPSDHLALVCDISWNKENLMRKESEITE